MTLGNMRANGVRSLDVCCWQCHHRAIFSADPWPDDLPVPTFGPRMVCSRCGIIGADARPYWRERERSAAGVLKRGPNWAGRTVALFFRFGHAPPLAEQIANLQMGRFVAHRENGRSGHEPN
jgi:hypothetical protein